MLSILAKEPAVEKYAQELSRSDQNAKILPALLVVAALWQVGNAIYTIAT